MLVRFVVVGRRSALRWQLKLPPLTVGAVTQSETRNKAAEIARGESLPHSMKLNACSRNLQYSWRWPVPLSPTSSYSICGQRPQEPLPYLLQNLRSANGTRFSVTALQHASNYRDHPAVRSHGPQRVRSAQSAQLQLISSSHSITKHQPSPPGH
jgi:hypothetical protein